LRFRVLLIRCYYICNTDVNIYILIVYTLSMDIEKIKKRRSEKSIVISIRVTPDISKWLRENDYSPTGIFYEALKDLGYKPR
jgi:hypothetical protein